MKRILLFLSIAAVAASCQGEQGIPGVPGPAGKDGAGIIEKGIINVSQENWNYSFDDNNSYFYATVDMSDIINEDIFDNALIKMYRVYDYNTMDARQIELPYVRPVERYVESNLDFGYNPWVFYTETVDYEVSIGKITIFYTRGDFEYELDDSVFPEDMQFKYYVLY